MFNINGAVKFKYIHNYRDMRGGYEKLSGVVRELSGGAMEEGTAYVFTSRNQKLVFNKLLFGKTSTAPVCEETSVVDIVNSSIFAPSETKRGDYMLVQVFLYIDDEERAVTCKAAEVDPDAHR